MASLTLEFRSSPSRFSIALLLVHVVLLLVVITPVSSDDTIHGCGGFVEASPTLAKMRKPSDPKLDYSHITVELYTLDGLVKESVQCAPNGYYFVPVYDKGTFVLQVKGLEGWSWDPHQVAVVADQNGCNDNEDINFRYTGFTLSGKVVGAVGGDSCERKGEGPAGVKFSLRSAESIDSIREVASVSTIPGGSFKFDNLIPGKYQLEAYHPTLKVDLKGPSEVTLGFGNAEFDDIFSIPGYNVEGLVVSQGNPVLGVHVYLYSDDIPEVPCPKESGNPPWPEPALCHAISNVNGKFMFSSLPCGKYKLLPYYRGENTVFDVSPASSQVVVGHGDVILTRPFQVTGFSVGGRVVDHLGRGVESVQILVNDVDKAMTDASGFYKLDQVTSTQYTIKAQKTHYKFTILDDFMVLPNIALIPNLVAVQYDLCGSIVLGSSIHWGKRQVALTHGPANVKPQTKYVDDKGSFCFAVPPGEYRLSPITSQAEISGGLVFSPSFLDILVNGPILDTMLTQAQVTVSGFVKCIDRCDTNISVTLSPYIPGTRDIDLGRTQIARLTSGKDEFFFDEVLPGKYQLKVKHEPSSGHPDWDDGWCWDTSTIETDVGTEDLRNIEFIQKGFWMNIQSTHSAEASLLQPNGEALQTQIKKGWQQICLEHPGIHELHFLKSCVFFGVFAFPYNTLNPVPIQLVGEKYLLTGRIFMQSSDHANNGQLAEKTVVIVWNEDGSFVDSNNRLRIVSDMNASAEMFTLEYNHWAKQGDKLHFIPKYISDMDIMAPESAKQFLYYPRQHYVHVTRDGCQPEIPSFTGRPGMYIEGSVTPPLDGVNITIIAKNDSIDGDIKKGEVVMMMLTGEDGSYLAGPLYDDINYVVQATKVGYHMKPLGDRSFSCQKLSQIAVHILPGEGAEDQLPSVLLSLSGDDGFRKNAITSSDGVYIFNSLFPGSFFLRPLLKEYTFSPSSRALDLESGNVVKVEFSASRISYSVLGSVTSLTGKPEEDISLEARAESKGYYEETTTDRDGRYRLRGLLPGTAYSVKVVLKEDNDGIARIERASPRSVTVQVEKNDTAGVDFVIFDQPSTTIITGYARGSGLKIWQQHLTIRIVSVNDAPKIERVIPLPLSYFFEVQGLPKGKYSVQLMLGLSEKTHKFESFPVDVDLERNPQVHVGPLQFVVEERYQKQDLTPAPVLPVIVGLMVILVFASMPRFKDAYQWAAGSGLSNTASAQPKRDVRKLAIRKRTY